MNDDLLFRGAESSAKKATDSFRSLETMPVSDLYRSLALRVQEESAERRRDDPPTRQAGYDALIDVDEIPRGGPGEGLGQKVFLRWSRVLCEVACGPSKEDSELRDRLITAVTGVGGGGIAVIAAVLTGCFGVAQPIAIIIAALVIRFVKATAVESVCHAWRTSLDAEPRHLRGRKP